MENKQRLLNAQTIAKVAILGALAFIVMLFEFPIPFIAPSFYKLDLSEVIVLIGGFALGPIAAIIIEALKNILNIIFTGSSTAYVGEVANFIVGCCFVVPASVIYLKNKTRNSAILGMAVGTICLVIAGALMNTFVLIPLYSKLFNLPIEVILGMGQAIFPSIKSVFSFVLYCVCPFNLIKGVIVSLITFFLYKRVSPLLHK